MLKIGIAGQRGLAFIKAFRALPGVDVAAFCDTNPVTLEQKAQEHGIEKRFTEFAAMLSSVDAVVVATPMQCHAEQSTLALEAGKHVLSEVTACITLDECWQLLQAAEKSHAVYAMAENYCYRKDVVLVRELVRKGLFGTPYFGEGEYLHEIRHYHHTLDGSPTWRAVYQVGRRGSTYGTHSLGPVMQWFLAADPGERIATVSCHGTGVHTDPEHPHDDTCLMLVQLASGKLIKVRLDMLSNRPHLPAYYALQGTHGVYEAARFPGQPGQVWLGESQDGADRTWTPLSELYDSHLPTDWRNPPPEALAAGHGGGDYFVVRDFVRACYGEAPPNCGIHDALAWTACDILSETSITNGGTPLHIPNFRDPKEKPLRYA
jgi:predicted dehydrogenase